MYQFLYPVPNRITSPIPFSFSKSCPFFRIQEMSQLHSMYDLPSGPAFNNLCSVWVLVARTIYSFPVYHALLWCLSLLCFYFPVALLLSFKMHYIFHAYIGCKFLRMDKLCLIICGVITALGSGPWTKKQPVKILLLHFSAASSILFVSKLPGLNKSPVLTVQPPIHCSAFSPGKFLSSHSWLFLVEKMWTTSLKNKSNIASWGQEKKQLFLAQIYFENDYQRSKILDCKLWWIQWVFWRWKAFPKVIHFNSWFFLDWLS